MITKDFRLSTRVPSKQKNTTLKISTKSKRTFRTPSKSKNRCSRNNKLSIRTKYANFRAKYFNSLVKMRP